MEAGARYDSPSLLGSRFASGVLVAIAAIGRTDDATGLEPALVDLSRIFYYAEGGPIEATMREELGFAELYLRLQALRFEERLLYRVAAEAEGLDLPIARLSLFPVLESAVADALELSSGPAFIAVEAGRMPGRGLGLRVLKGRTIDGPCEEVGRVAALGKRGRIPNRRSPS